MQWGPSSPIEQSFEPEGTRVVTHMELSSPPMSPRHLESASGLTAQVNANGSIRRMSHRGVLLNLFLGNEVEGGPANIYLRRHDDEDGAIGLHRGIAPSSDATIEA